MTDYVDETPKRQHKDSTEQGIRKQPPQQNELKNVDDVRRNLFAKDDEQIHFTIQTPERPFIIKDGALCVDELPVNTSKYVDVNTWLVLYYITHTVEVSPISCAHSPPFSPGRSIFTGLQIML